MKKSEIETYMDAYMEGFWACYCTMFDLIDDDDSIETTQESLKKSRIVPEPRNVPHAPEKPTKAPMPEVKPTHDKFVELFKEGKLPTEVAKELGVSPATAYNHLTKAKDKGELS